MSVAGWCSAEVGIGSAGAIENFVGVPWVCVERGLSPCLGRHIRARCRRGWMAFLLGAVGYDIGPWWCIVNILLELQSWDRIPCWPLDGKDERETGLR